MKNKLYRFTLLGVTAITTLHSEQLVKPASAPVEPCTGIHQHVTALVASDPEQILEIVSKEITANPSCSCEVVKAAIQQSKREAKPVAAIVEAAIIAAPEHMRMTAECAIAAAPDATAEVQAVVARLDPNTGDLAVHDAKSGLAERKDAKSPMGEDALVPTGEDGLVSNPLDFPGQSPSDLQPGDPTLVGLTPDRLAPAGAGGNALFPPVIPAAVNPPALTRVNPNAFGPRP